LGHLRPLQFTINEFDKSLISLIKATEIQRDIDDKENLAITYSLNGILHAAREEYKDALEYLKSAKQLLKYLHFGLHNSFQSQQ